MRGQFCRRRILITAITALCLTGCVTTRNPSNRQQISSESSRAEALPLPAEPGRAEIVPRIKSTQMLKFLAERGYSRDQVPVTEPLVGDLVISYAFDLPQMFQMVTPYHLKRLAIKPGELRAIAIANLKHQLPEIGMTKKPHVMRVVTGNDLEACVLLADSWWNKRAAETPGEIVASVPNRNTLLYCSSKSAEGLRALRKFTDEAYASETTHALSKHLFVWRKGHWSVFQ
jgi:uncharacterized protein YtpQ (UPF0354 family)